MFDRDSRYAELPTAVHVESDGREVVYVTRRFLPRPDALLELGRVHVEAGERLDLFAARTLGSADAWWRVPDANPVVHPEELEPSEQAPVPRRLLVATEAP